MNPKKLLLRAFSGNLAKITVTEKEQAGLSARGVTEPVVQRYLVWRGAMMLMVVIATLFSMGWTTWTELNDTGEEPSVLEEISEDVLAEEGGAAAAHDDSADAAPDDAAAPAPAATTAPNKSAAGAEHHAEHHKETAFAKFADLVQTAALYALAGSALLAFLLRNRPKLSYRILAAGFLFGFFVPIAIALCPWSWWEPKHPGIAPVKDPDKFLDDAAETALAAVAMLGGLLPAVLALIPGVLKGCLRVKTLLPASTLPGWFVVMTAPLYGLFLLAVFTAMNQVTGDTLLLGGVLLLIIAHMMYAVRGSTFTRPLTTPEDLAAMKKSKLIILVLTLGAGGLIVAYLTTRDFLGAHILGTDPEKSFMTPWDLIGLGLEFVSRAMFVGVLSVDLFMRINRTAWNDVKRLEQSDSTGGYQNTMEAMNGIMK